MVAAKSPSDELTFEESLEGEGRIDYGEGNGEKGVERLFQAEEIAGTKAKQRPDRFGTVNRRRARWLHIWSEWERAPSDHCRPS